MKSAKQTSPKDWQLLCGKEEILSHSRALQQLATKSGMEGALDFLEFFLSAPYFLQDVPHPSLKLLKFLPNAALTRRAKLPRMVLRRSGGEIDAAVFVFEYSLHGLRTGCYIPADSDGYRTVVAPEPMRQQAAVQAGECLLRRGALLLLLSYMEAVSAGKRLRDDDREQPATECIAGPPAERVNGRRLLAHQVRELGRKLPLGESFEQTLAGVSRNTRHNLRRSMLQAREDLGAVFQPEADIDLPALQELAGQSAYGPPDWAVEERFTAARTLPGGVLAGLRDSGGRWLSVVGAHRERDMLCLDWQLNRSGLGSISLATAMRGVLIDSEISLGTRWLRFESGTTHPLQRAFLQERSHDLLFARRILPTALLKRLAAGMAEGGPLATVLASEGLIWRS